MEQMYQDYKDIVDFQLVYIKEAHAADSNWAVDYARDLGITEHDDHAERCEVADKLIKDKALTMPFLIDDMEDTVNKAYSAHPDRVFLVRADGRLAVAAQRGPKGFAPALAEVAAWLKQYREQGAEPELPGDAAEAGEDMNVKAVLAKRTAEQKAGDDSDGN